MDVDQCMTAAVVLTSDTECEEGGVRGGESREEVTIAKSRMTCYA